MVMEAMVTVMVTEVIEIMMTLDMVYQVMNMVAYFPISVMDLDRDMEDRMDMEMDSVIHIEMSTFPIAAMGTPNPEDTKVTVQDQQYQQ